MIPDGREPDDEAAAMMAHDRDLDQLAVASGSEVPAIDAATVLEELQHHRLIFESRMHQQTGRAVHGDGGLLGDHHQRQSQWRRLVSGDDEFPPLAAFRAEVVLGRVVQPVGAGRQVGEFEGADAVLSMLGLAGAICTPSAHCAMARR